MKLEQWLLSTPPTRSGGEKDLFLTFGLLFCIQTREEQLSLTEVRGAELDGGRGCACTLPSHPASLSVPKSVWAALISYRQLTFGDFSFSF